MENANAENAKKRFILMNLIKWLGLGFGLIMFVATRDAFGQIWAAVLAVLAAVGFFVICHREGRNIMCQCVADDLKDAVETAGHSRCVVEIRSSHVGLLTRVYLIGAGKRAAMYGRAVVQRINDSWYRRSIWAAQMIDLMDESEIEDAQFLLDEELLKTLKQIRGELRDRSKDSEKGDWGDRSQEDSHTRIRPKIMDMMDKIDVEDQGDAAGCGSEQDAEKTREYQKKQEAEGKEPREQEAEGKEPQEREPEEKEQK